MSLQPETDSDFTRDAKSKAASRKAAPLYAWGTRNWFQLGVFMVTLAMGFQFYMYVEQAFSTGPMTVQRPPGVEGFLPIGALMGWKLFFFTGMWDPVHPAAMVILGFAGAVSLVLRKSFCGWFCPVGFLSEWLWKLGRKIFGRNFQMPRWLDYTLRSLKYILLGFFVFTIFSMSAMAIIGFIHGAYYQLSDVKMLFFFTRMTGLTAGVLAGLMGLSLLFRNFWCRYLCPYGALMGLLAMAGPTRIQRNQDTCIDCGRCQKACPYHLPVDTKASIKSAECIGCLDCVQVCPQAKTLELKTSGLGKSPWKPGAMGLAVMGLFLLCYFAASVSGHWQGSVSDQRFRQALASIDSPDNRHPSIQFRGKDVEIPGR